MQGYKWVKHKGVFKLEIHRQKIQLECLKANDEISYKSEETGSIFLRVRCNTAV